jgi:hypothetical protein
MPLIPFFADGSLKISSLLFLNACNLAGKANLPACSEAVLLSVFQEEQLRFEGHPRI